MTCNETIAVAAQIIRVAEALETVHPSIWGPSHAKWLRDQAWALREAAAALPGERRDG